MRPHLKLAGTYRSDETYVKVKCEWKYHYRADCRDGQTIELLSWNLGRVSQ